MRSDDPAILSPAERVRELAGILAVGILRLRDRTALATESGVHPALKNSSKTVQDCLEVSKKTVLSVHGG